MIVFCVGHRSKQPDRRFSSTSLNAWMLCFCGNSDSPSSDTCRKDVSARCGKPLPCSVRDSSLPDGQISLAVFLKLPNCLSLANKYRNVFIRCSYHYVNNGLDTLGTQFVNVMVWSVLEG